MVAPTETSASIRDTVAFGTQLATALQTLLEVSWVARDTLEDVACTVSGTTSVLSQLQDVIDANHPKGSHDHSGIFKAMGLVEVNSAAEKCHSLFKIIIAVVVRASVIDSSKGDQAASLSIRERAADPTLGPGALTVSKIIFRDATWIKPRIHHCQTQLCYLKMTLLLHLQIANLAKLYNRGLRPAGTFDQELCFRATAVKLRQRQVKLAKGEMKRQRKDSEVLTWGASDSESVTSDDNDSDSATLSNSSGASKPAVSPETKSADASRPSFRPTASDSLSPSPAATLPPPVVRMPVPAAASQLHPPSSGVLSPTAPPYAPVAPVGHQGLGYNPMTTGATNPFAAGMGGAEKPQPLNGPGDVAQGSYDMRPPAAIPEKTCHATHPPLAGDDEKASSSSGDDMITTPAAQGAAVPGLPDSASVTDLFRPTFSIKRRLGSWFGGLFGRASENDKLVEKLLATADKCSSSVLEAYLVGGGAHYSLRPIKVPLGHEQLKHGLARALRGVNTRAGQASSTWPNHLLNLTTTQREMVNSAIVLIEKGSPDQRTCVAIQECKTGEKEGRFPTYVLFFSVAEAPRPIEFKDAVGRIFVFPYESCKEWKDMKELINSAFLHVSVLGPHVLEGHYDLCLSYKDGNKVVLPSLWSSNIFPGAVITMHMWPMDQRKAFPAPLVMHTRPVPAPPFPGVAGGGDGFIPLKPPPPPPPVIVDVYPNRPPRRVSAREQEAKEKDYRDMAVIDFTLEVNDLEDDSAAGAVVADMIRRFTHIEDADFTAFVMVDLDWDDDLEDYNSSSSSSYC